jgi:hypothetical protein
MGNRDRCLAVIAGLLGLSGAGFAAFPVPEVPFAPREYPCYFTAVAPAIDGVVERPLWDQAPWSEAFVDIRGEHFEPGPRHRTRAKLLWDAQYLFVAAELDEPDLWGTYTQRDAVIYHENDFEIFLDPDSDSHFYYELEINALGTVWDLLLPWPYRDGNSAINGWDIAGLRSAVSLDGTLNDPLDTDRGWSVELALPWTILAECARRPAPPDHGDIWRLNFSRVQWHLDKGEGGYTKRLRDDGSGPLPEDNWVWSPQGLVAMHYPERWGYLHFLSAPEARLEPVARRPDQRAAALLWELYYRQMAHRDRHGRWHADVDGLLDGLGAPDGYAWPPRLEQAGDRWTIGLDHKAGGSSLAITESGRLLQPPLKRGSR